MEPFKKAVEAILKKEVKGSITLEIPPDPALGDFAFPCFALAKEQKKKPNEVAQELARKLQPTELIPKIEVKGPYVNFFVHPGKFAEAVLQQIEKEGKDYGKCTWKKERVLLEFPSPNTNKPLHLGHLRNIFLAMSLAALYEFFSNAVYRVNLNNDRGIHICKSMLAYQQFGKGKQPDKKTDHFVGDFYVLYNQKLQERPELEEEAKEMLKKWEEGNREMRALWKKMNAWALEGFDATYQRLGVQFDKVYHESAFYEKARNVVAEGLKKGVFRKEPDGAVLVELEQYKLPNKILLRADGTTIYMTQDLYLAEQKFKDFKVDKSIYVVGNEQNLHFQQLFKILELLGHGWAKSCHHLSYGMVNLPHGRMKSREGTVVDADDLLDEMEKLAMHEIEQRHPELNKKLLAGRAKQIGHGALRFFILKMDPVKNMVYHPEESLNFEGETGPYVQYAHARICSILKKHGKAVAGKAALSLLKEPEEQQLIRHLAQFPLALEESLRNHKPSTLCQYLLMLAQAFNAFYHQHQILQAAEEFKLARLQLILGIRQVLEIGLHLLCIDAPEEM